MGLFLALTTLVEIRTGLEIINVYDEKCPTTLIVEGIFNVASVGILIYMVFVDLFAVDFMNLRIQKTLNVYFLTRLIYELRSSQFMCYSRSHYGVVIFFFLLE
jgi:hypothetical protein